MERKIILKITNFINTQSLKLYLCSIKKYCCSTLSA